MYDIIIIKTSKFGLARLKMGRKYLDYYKILAIYTNNCKHVMLYTIQD